MASNWISTNSSLFFLIRDIIFVNEFKILLKSYEVLQTTWEKEKKILKIKRPSPLQTFKVKPASWPYTFYLLIGTFYLFSLHELRADAINSFHNSQPLIKEPIWS